MACHPLSTMKRFGSSNKLCVVQDHTCVGSRIRIHSVLKARPLDSVPIDQKFSLIGVTKWNLYR